MFKAIKSNPLIAASVLLPVALVIVFALAGAIPKLLVAPPQHDLILASFDPAAADAQPLAINIVVDDGRVVARVTRLEPPEPRGRQRIYRFDHASGDIRELTIAWPTDIDDIADGTALPIPALADATVSTSIRAPDGYEYRGFERHGGLLFGLFGDGRSDNGVTISKNGAIVPIELPNSANYWYGQAQFIGWVVQ